MREVIARHGAWTAANVELAPGLYTISAELAGAHPRLVRFGQLIADASGASLSALRILDLACLEGEYAIEFARQGARVMGIEGRKDNIRKAELARDALGLHNLELVQDDVRRLDPDRHGLFDAVLCSGILYHLDAPDVAEFLERIGAVCRRCLVVDTHVSPTESERFEYKGRTYAGSRFTEHHAAASAQEKEASRWASLDNRTSFWFTLPSLVNALTAAGFTTVTEVHSPAIDMVPGRITLLAIKGAPYGPSDPRAAAFERAMPERASRHLGYRLRMAGREIAMRLPRPLLQLARRLFARPRG